MAKENPPVVFGPVLSRRFGKSLGVDLSPSKNNAITIAFIASWVRPSPLNAWKKS